MIYSIYYFILWAIFPPKTLLNYSYSIILYLSSKFLSFRIQNYFSIECPRISKREMIDWQFREGLELASHSRMIDRQLRKGLQAANGRDRWLKCLRCTIVWYSRSINDTDERKRSKMLNRKTSEKRNGEQKASSLMLNKDLVDQSVSMAANVTKVD